MSETIIKSDIPGSGDITIAQGLGHVVIAKSLGNHPAKFMVLIPDEDFPAVFKALQAINNEVHERESI